jgi:imidazolonepropionase-like amidohydrolase
VNLRIGTLLLVFALAAASTAAAETIAVTGAKVITLGPAGTLKNGTVVIRDGRITAVGREIPVPRNARVIDAKGKVVTPGLFDPQGQIGIVEVSQIEETVDSEQSDENYTASFEIADAINPRSMLIPINRIDGLTRAMVAPAPGHGEGSGPLIGQGTVIHLGGVHDFIVLRNAAMFMELGESGAALAHGARGNAILRLREALEDALHYAADPASYEAGDGRDVTPGRLDLQALVPVATARMPLVVSVERASDIAAILDLGQRFDLSLVISGGTEAWMLAERLAAARVPVILDPTDNLPASFESLGATMENAARLEAAGVIVAFASDETHNASNIRQLAGNAVAHGLPYEAGIAAITLNPARIYGLDAELGTLERGKAGDLVIWDGDPLEVTSVAEHVVIAGRSVPMVSRSTLLRDRYMELNRPLPPAYTN